MEKITIDDILCQVEDGTIKLSEINDAIVNRISKITLGEDGYNKLDGEQRELLRLTQLSDLRDTIRLNKVQEFLDAQNNFSSSTIIQEYNNKKYFNYQDKFHEVVEEKVLENDKDVGIYMIHDIINKEYNIIGHNHGELTSKLSNLKSVESLGIGNWYSIISYEGQRVHMLAGKETGGYKYINQRSFYYIGDDLSTVDVETFGNSNKLQDFGEAVYFSANKSSIHIEKNGKHITIDGYIRGNDCKIELENGKKLLKISKSSPMSNINIFSVFDIGTMEVIIENASELYIKGNTIRYILSNHDESKIIQFLEKYITQQEVERLEFS